MPPQPPKIVPLLATRDHNPKAYVNYQRLHPRHGSVLVLMRATPPRVSVAGRGKKGGEHDFRHGAVLLPRGISAKSCRDKTGLFGELFPET